MKIKSILLTSVAILGLCSGCNDSFLDETPTDKLSDVSFWKNKEDVEKYTTSLYLYTLAPGNFEIMLDCYTDNAVPVHVHAEQGEISSGEATSTNDHFRQVWQTTYRGIRRCNIFFQNIDNVKMNDVDKKVYEGEVYFMRGYFYATLLRLYGGVPLLEKPLELNEAIPARNTAEEVYNFVIKDLDKAASLLPLKQTEVGRATKGAALAEKAVISNFMNKYDVAEKAAKEVMDLNVYSLFPDYSKLFLPESENNKETIFDHQYLENAKDDYLGSEIDQYFAPQMMGGWEAVSPTKDFVDLYECTDGKSITESPLYDDDNPFVNRDPRLECTILHDGSVIAGKTYSSGEALGNSTRTGYSIRKYINPKNDGMNYPGWTNFMYIRYAEILLIYAEAKNEVSGPSSEVYKAVNMIRKRVNMPDIKNNMTKDQLRQTIRDEVRRELAFEGVYFYDTRHWRTTEAAMTKPVYGKKVNGKYAWIETRKFNKDRDYLWAIPLVEIDLSKGTLVQNPGY